MSKSFTKLKPASLGPFDFFTFGKYTKCRVDSIITSDPDYILWLQRNAGTKFDPIVSEMIASEKTKKDMEQYLKEEIKPWIPKDMHYGNRYGFDDFDDDIPF